MMRDIHTPALLAAFAVAFAPAQALAESAAARLTLHVRGEPYCGIAWSNQDIKLNRNGAALIGRVVDSCNTRGYVVTAQFENLRGGALIVDGESYPIGADGMVQLISATAQLRAASWRLEDANFAPGATSTNLRLSIAPA